MYTGIYIIYIYTGIYIILYEIIFRNWKKLPLIYFFCNRNKMHKLLPSFREPVIKDSLYTVESIAVDWISHNLYWVDATTVSTLYMYLLILPFPPALTALHVLNIYIATYNTCI